MEENKQQANEVKPKNNMPVIIVIVSAVFILGGLFFLIRPASEKTVEQDNQSPATTLAVTTNANTINIEAGSFYYKPNKITVKKGDTIKVVINSVDKMHDFVIEELSVRTPIVKAGNSGEVTFVANTAGEYEFYCSVGTHRQQGMVGTLIVEE